MKKFFVLSLLALGAVKADAALFVNNSSTCVGSLELMAHDVNNPVPCAYYTWYKIMPGAYAYNDVTYFNTPPQVWRITALGPLYPATLVAQGSGWDAARIDIAGNTVYVGNPGSCASGTTQTFTSGTCTYTITWTAIGSNVIINIS